MPSFRYQDPVCSSITFHHPQTLPSRPQQTVPYKSQKVPKLTPIPAKHERYWKSFVELKLLKPSTGPQLLILKETGTQKEMRAQHVNT